ncbi:hypothetical protein [Lysobacter enzymogenes]|uniref:hypothetical protein n=1 Tax=Lysobacter enzymogenes TaxID=69 RepID=UPI0019D0DC21|nr:hypothetical protein [Lysobacter enzymogenes]
MKIRPMPLCAGLLSLIVAPAALSQTYTARAQLDLAATGESFAIGDKTFRLAPSAVVRKAGPATDAGQVRVASYAIDPAPAASPASRSRSARSVDAPTAAPAENLAAAMSADGTVVVLRPQLNVYFNDASVVNALVRDTGGTLVYSSAVGGKAIVRYGSVAEAMQARQRIQGRAGVKQVNPDLVRPRVHPM